MDRGVLTRKKCVSQPSGKASILPETLTTELSLGRPDRRGVAGCAAWPNVAGALLVASSLLRMAGSAAGAWLLLAVIISRAHPRCALVIPNPMDASVREQRLHSRHLP